MASKALMLFGLAALFVGVPLRGQDSATTGPWLAGEFTIDPFHSFANFEYDHFGLSTGRGRFRKTAGTITITDEGRQALVDVTIDVNSIDTGVDLLDSRLKSEAFFDAAKHPTITFRSTGVRFSGATLSEVPGQLTIKGVTKPVVLKVLRAACKKERNPTLKYPACGADAELELNRSDFGVGAFAPLVSDRVKIAVTVEAIKGAEGIQAQFQPFRK